RDASKQGYEATELAASLLGVPTSKTDVGLMAIPVVGGAIRVSKPALKSVFGLLLRGNADDAGRTLAKLAGTKGYEGVEFVPHVGAVRAGELPGGKFNPLNPSSRMDNCVAGVCALLRNKLERRGFDPLSADEIERLFGWAGKERKFTEGGAMEYMNRVLEETGHRVGDVVPFRQTTGALAPVPGHYVIFAGKKGAREHVVYGRILPNGIRRIYDPQLGRTVEWDELVNRYGGAVARQIEAAE
ncbi:MAG: hypothetical protein ACO1OB_10425, partial [Archangium sp.]